MGQAKSVDGKVCGPRKSMRRGREGAQPWPDGRLQGKEQGGGRGGGTAHILGARAGACTIPPPGAGRITRRQRDYGKGGLGSQDARSGSQGWSLGRAGRPLTQERRSLPTQSSGS